MGVATTGLPEVVTSGGFSGVPAASAAKGSGPSFSSALAAASSDRRQSAGGGIDARDGASVPVKSHPSDDKGDDQSGSPEAAAVAGSMMAAMASQPAPSQAGQTAAPAASGQSVGDSATVAAVGGVQSDGAKVQQTIPRVGGVKGTAFTPSDSSGIGPAATLAAIPREAGANGTGDPGTIRGVTSDTPPSQTGGAKGDKVAAGATQVTPSGGTQQPVAANGSRGDAVGVDTVEKLAAGASSGKIVTMSLIGGSDHPAVDPGNGAIETLRGGPIAESPGVAGANGDKDASRAVSALGVSSSGEASAAAPTASVPDRTTGTDAVPGAGVTTETASGSAGAVSTGMTTLPAPGTALPNDVSKGSEHPTEVAFNQQGAPASASVGIGAVGAVPSETGGAVAAAGPGVAKAVVGQPREDGGIRPEEKPQSENPAQVGPAVGVASTASMAGSGESKGGETGGPTTTPGKEQNSNQLGNFSALTATGATTDPKTVASVPTGLNGSPQTAAGTVLDQLVAHAAKLSLPKNSSLRVELRPASLGYLDLRLGLRDGVLTLHILAQSDNTREMIQSALPQLRQALEGKSLEIGQMILGSPRDGAGASQDGSARSFGQWQDGRRQQSAVGELRILSEPSAIPALSTNGRGGQHLVDYRV